MGNKQKRTTAVTQNFNRPLLDEARLEFADILKDQDVIRIYVDGTPGMGHQASSIHVLRALATTPEPPDFGYGYVRTIEVYYQIRNPGEDTLEKLHLLLPELDGQNEGYLNGQGSAFISLIPYDDTQPPADRVAFGFTGGADNYPTEHDVPDFARYLNVTYFLKLQPYKWSNLQGIQHHDGDYIDFNNVEILGSETFVNRAYYQPPIRLSDEIWDQYTNNPNATLRNRARILQWLIGQAQDGEIDLQMVYGVRSTNCPMKPTNAVDVLISIIMTALEWQWKNKEPWKASKPTVVVNLDLFNFAEIGAEENSIEYITNVLAGGYIISEQEIIAGHREHRLQSRDLGAYEVRCQYLELIKAADRARVQDGGSLQDVTAFEDWLKSTNDHVLFVQLGPVPPPLFNVSFANSTLPVIFEGMGTANLALSLGRWYLHVRRSGIDRVLYPNVTLTDDPTDAGREFQDAADRVRWSLGYSDYGRGFPKYAELQYEEGLEEIAPYQIALFLQKYFDQPHDGELKTYIAGIENFYANPNNCKLRLAVTYLNSVVKQSNVMATDAAPPTLEQLYETFEKEIAASGRVALLPGALSGFIDIAQYYDALLSALKSQLVIDDAKLERDPDAALKWVKLSGTTTAQLGPSDAPTGVAAELEFTAPNGTVTLSAKYTETSNYILDNIPWIPVKDPFFQIVTADGLPAAGSIGATIDKIDLTVAFRFPATDDQWAINGTFETPVGVEDVFQLMGGVNIAQSLQGPFKLLTALKATELRLLYDAEARKPASCGAKITTTETVELIPNLVLEALTMDMTVVSPADLKSRTTSVDVQGQFKIGARADAGVIQIGASFPGVALIGQLVSGTIQIEDLLSLFLPGVPLDLPAVPSIDAFQFGYNVANKDYSVNCNLNIDWPITIDGTTVFTIENVTFQVANTNGVSSGRVAGSMTILPDDPAGQIGVTVAAAYDGTDGGWTFSGLTTSPINLGALLSKQFGFDPGDQSGYVIDSLALTIATADNSWTFVGSASDWRIDFLDLTINKAALTAGYVSKKTDGAGKAPTAATALVPVTAATAKEERPAGYFADIAVETTWLGMRINPGVKFATGKSPAWTVTLPDFGLTTEVAKNDKQQWVGELGFTQNTTLGSMIETMVSWVTGTGFGLEAPWSVLNDISLSGLKLVYNFTTGNVAFNVDIGPIDLGVARVDAIEVSYVTGKPDPKDNGLMVSLKGSFAWNVGSDAKGDTSTLGPWDASKPGETPAPPGGGNKYLDLRLLALGQHVTVSGLTEEKNVAAVIDKLRRLKVPVPPDIPVGGPNQPDFDPDSSWFIAFDFGVLKVEDKQDADGGTVAAALPGPSDGTVSAPVPVVTRNALSAEDKATYFISLGVVFNDPRLYALRIGLDGPMAKIFAGLDFQIMYQQVSKNVGKYSAEIVLPDIMRKFQIGVASITLPTFSIEIYTNGDFQVDIGFPWKEDFSVSFSIEVQVGPLPMLGSAGFYFGKLSSATTDNLPATDAGWFNPVIVFGFGAQIGLGKSIELGILKAGFSLTVFGIVEGVIARWQPYTISTPEGNKNNLQDGYYFALTGTMGLQGRLYGSVNFAIISAELNIAIKLYVRITFKSYESIPITAAASVDVTLTVKINLGLFKISIHLGFKATVTATFVLDNPMKGPAPWAIGASSSAVSAFERLQARALRKNGFGNPRSLVTMAADVDSYIPDWSNLQPGDTLNLTGYVAPALTVAGDIAATPDNQTLCYVVNFLIEGLKPIQTDAGAGVAENTAPSAALVVAPDLVAQTALARARGLAAMNVGHTFEDLAVRVLQWIIAAGRPGEHSVADVNDMLVDDEFLASTIDYLSGATTPTPIPDTAIETFLDQQTTFVFALKETPNINPDGQEEPVSAVFFPAAPGVTLDVPAFAGAKKLGYAFGGYNSSTTGYLESLNTYFNQLKVQIEKEAKAGAGALGVPGSNGPSIASYIFGDYFAMIGRLMLQSLRDGLRNFKLAIADHKDATALDLVDFINRTGGLTGGETPGGTPADPFTLAELFVANASHPLTATNGHPLTISNMTWQSAGGQSFNEVAAAGIFGGGFDGSALALKNATNGTIIASGQRISFDNTTYTTQSNDSLDVIAVALGFGDRTAPNVAALLAAVPEILSNGALIAPQSIFDIPDFTRAIQAGETLQDIAQQYGLDVETLANTPNGAIPEIFDSTGEDPYLNVPHLPQFRVGALIDEMVYTLALQHVSAQVSRYYLHGLRLPTRFTAPNENRLLPLADGLFVEKGGEYPEDLGLFALTGQAIPLSDTIPDPTKAQPEDPNFTFTLGATAVDWLSLGAAGGDSVTFTLDGKNGNVNYQQYDAVRALALGAYLATGSSAIAPLETAAAEPSRFPLSQQIAWQPAVPVTLPRHTMTPATPRPRMWPLPAELINVPNGVGINPTMIPVLARSDEARGKTVDEAVSNYGFGTLINFSVRRLQTAATTGVATRTYEIIGAPESEIILLERLLAQLTDTPTSFRLVNLLYRPPATGSNGNGWQSDDPAASLLGITQTNLSTETRPPDGVMAMSADTAPGNLIGTPNEILRLLWEASITRQGGFYLNYTLNEDGELKGLPDHAFNDRGEAEVAMLALFDPAAETGGMLANYMNVVATDEPFDLSNASMIARAVPVSVPVNKSRDFVPGTDTLTSYAASCYMGVGVLAELNKAVAFNTGAMVVVEGGSYQVPAVPPQTPTKDNPGGDLDQIALHFGTTKKAIQDANIAGASLPAVLAPLTAIKLPRIVVEIGKDPAMGRSFETLSSYFRAPIPVIAAANADALGDPVALYPEAPLAAVTGPVSLAPQVRQGVAGITLQRPEPIVPESGPPDAAWATAYLRQMFSLLGYRIAPNTGNSYFTETNWGLPGGPINPETDSDGDKVNAPSSTTADGIWHFSVAVPYATVLGKDEPDASPYLGVGSLLQLDLGWVDIFGNRVLSELDNPAPATDAPLNKAPQITGYTDRVAGIGQWPSVASAYQVTAQAVTNEPTLTLLLNFDSTVFVGAAKSVLGPDPDRAMAGRRIIEQAIAVYDQIIDQLTDPSGVTVTLTTTITPGVSWTDLTNAEPSGPVTMVGWAQAIRAYLDSLLKLNAGTTPPPFDYPDWSTTVTLDIAQLNLGQIFKLDTTLTVARTASLVAGELRTVPGVTQTKTSITPLTGPLGTNVNGGETIQRGLSQFGADFTDAFNSIVGYSFRVATGSDRAAFSGSGNGALWCVQLGDKGTGNPIGYSITNKNAPTVFAPRPIANVLKSKARTPIIGYETGVPISLNGTSQDLAFSSVDLDKWMGVALAQVDELLTPKYVSPAEILRKNIEAVPNDGGSWSNALQSVLDAKLALADALRHVMIPVYDGEEADKAQRDDIQEAFYQSLLGTLGQYYAVKAGFQFDSQIHADIQPQPSATEPPRVYGDIQMLDLVPSASAAEAQKPDPKTASVSLSSPKLDLRFSGGQDGAVSRLSSLLSTTATEAKRVTLNLRYSGQNIEHEIGSVPGIEGYRPSSWLSFVDIDDETKSPLFDDLGQFDVPIVLRSFPDTPTLVNQEMLSSFTGLSCYQPVQDGMGAEPGEIAAASACTPEGTFNPLKNVTQWGYGFIYSMQVHHLQDDVHGTITFNVATRVGASAALQRDLFDNLAQFVHVYPDVLADLNTYLVPVDVDTTDPTQLTNAQYALESAATMINWIAASAKAEFDNADVSDDSSTVAASPGDADPIGFVISQDVAGDPGGDVPADALQITVELTNPLPPRVGNPIIEVPGYTCIRLAAKSTAQKGVFVYKDDKGQYLTAAEARVIPQRRFILPELQILERQDAQSEIYLTRNAGLVPDKIIAEPFVYTTPDVSFESPLHPTIVNTAPINLATIYAVDASKPERRSLECQLSVLYDVLFKNAGTKTVTLQLGAYYNYSINAAIEPVRLPVFLMPPTRAKIGEGGTGTPITDLIAQQVQTWKSWFTENEPSTLDGRMTFELIVMSDLTAQPMPILKLTGIYVDLTDLTDGWLYGSHGPRTGADALSNDLTRALDRM